MRRLRRLTIATAVVMASVGAAGAGTAMATALADLSYTVKNLPGGSPFVVQYSSGVFQGQGGTAQAQSGGIGTVSLLDNAVFLFSASPLSASVDHWVLVGSPPVTGTVTLPAGATATVTNSITQKQFTLTNGPFSIPTGIGQLGASLPAGGTRTIRCKGSANGCTATVPIAGGAANRKLIIRLSDTNLRLQTVTAVPRSSTGAYLLSHGRYALGGSEYRVTLDAVKANPKGSHIVLAFAAVK